MGEKGRAGWRISGFCQYGDPFEAKGEAVRVPEPFTERGPASMCKARGAERVRSRTVCHRIFLPSLFLPPLSVYP